MRAGKRVILIKVDIVNWVKNLMWLIIFLAFIKPEYLARNDTFDSACNYVRVATCIFSVMGILLSKRISGRLLVVVFYLFPVLIVTIINGGDVYKAIASMVVIFAMFAMFENLGLKEIKNRVKILNFLLLVILVIDVITILAYPNGLYQLENTREITFYTDDVWFLGYKNDHPPYYFLACFTSVLCIFFNDMKRKYFYIAVIVHIASLLGVISMFAGCGIYSFVIYIGLLICLLKIKSFKMEFNHAVGIHIILFILLTTVSLNPMFIKVFSIIGKERTMAIRAKVWTTTWEYVSRSILWGHGYENSIDLLWLQKMAAGAVTSHNSIMDMFLVGGCITASAFILLLFQIGKKIRWLRAESKKLYAYLSIVFFASFMLAQTEGFMRNVPIFMMLSIMANLEPAKNKKIRFGL